MHFKLISPLCNLQFKLFWSEAWAESICISCRCTHTFMWLRREWTRVLPCFTRILHWLRNCTVTFVSYTALKIFTSMASVLCCCCCFNAFKICVDDFVSHSQRSWSEQSEVTSVSWWPPPSLRLARLRSFCLLTARRRRMMKKKRREPSRTGPIPLALVHSPC